MAQPAAGRTAAARTAAARTAAARTAAGRPAVAAGRPAVAAGRPEPVAPRRPSAPSPPSVQPGALTHGWIPPSPFRRWPRFWLIHEAVPWCSRPLVSVVVLILPVKLL